MDGLSDITELERQLSFIDAVFPLLLLGFYEVLFIVVLFLKHREEDRVVREIKEKSWKNNKRRASDSLKTFLANDTTP